MDQQPKHAKEPVKSDTFSTDVFEVDDRLINLERQSNRHRDHLVRLEDVLVDQMMLISVLELALAILVAMALWDQFKGAAHA